MSASSATAQPPTDRHRHARAARRSPRPRGRRAPGRSERDRNPPRLSLRLSYTQALQEAGAIAVVLPAHGFVDDVAPLLDRLDGLLFSGGPDLDPATYGHERHPLLGPDVDRVADEYELALLREAHRARPAAARDLPRDAGAQRRPRRHAAPAPARPHAARAPPDARALRARARRHGRARLAAAPAHRPPPPRRQQLPPPGRRRARRAARAVRPRAGRHDRGALRPAARFCLGVQWHAELLTHRAEHAPLLQRAGGRGGEPRGHAAAPRG